MRLTQLDNEPVISIDRLLHIIETAIAGDVYAAYYVRIEFEKSTGLAYRQHYTQFASPHLGRVYGLKVSIVKLKFIAVKPFFQLFQIYF